MTSIFYTALSPIHGIGLFINQHVPAGIILFKVMDANCVVTEIGQWVNHSLRPNIILHKEPDGYYAISSSPICKDCEIVGNYQFTPDCLEKPSPNW